MQQLHPIWCSLYVHLTHSSPGHAFMLCLPPPFIWWYRTFPFSTCLVKNPKPELPNQKTHVTRFSFNGALMWRSPMHTFPGMNILTFWIHHELATLDITCPNILHSSRTFKAGYTDRFCPELFWNVQLPGHQVQVVWTLYYLSIAALLVYLDFPNTRALECTFEPTSCPPQGTTSFHSHVCLIFLSPGLLAHLPTAIQ